MRILRVLRASRVIAGAGLLGFLALIGGCGDDNKNAQVNTATPEEIQAKQDAERAAREKAMRGAVKGNPAPGSPDAK